MSLKQIGEFGFIKRISRGCVIRPENVIKAIGDDAAAFCTNPGMVTLITTDMLVERIHFLRNAISGFDLGYKSMAVNLSDIAAMGGTACQAFVGIAIPDDCAIDYLDDIYKGMKDLAARFDVNILGGDTTGSKVDLVINVVVQGTVLKEELLCRDGARPGDIICSTGFLGDSRAGLYLILNNLTPGSKELESLLRAHLHPEPHLREGRFLAVSTGVHAAIDTSDGLSSDLGHICEQSRVGARLYAECLPLSDNLRHFCTTFGLDPIDYALSGGEDYTLLCTVSPKQAEGIARGFETEFNRPLFRLGEITDSRDIELLFPDGRSRRVTPTGWDHFSPMQQE